MLGRCRVAGWWGVVSCQGVWVQGCPRSVARHELQEVGCEGVEGVREVWMVTVLEGGVDG